MSGKRKTLFRQFKAQNRWQKNIIKKYNLLRLKDLENQISGLVEELFTLKDKLEVGYFTRIWNALKGVK